MLVWILPDLAQPIKYEICPHYWLSKELFIIHCSTNESIAQQQNEIPLAERYAMIARDANGYNEAALVNLGNCCFQKGEFSKAKEYYATALEIDASCVEAIYNLGKYPKVWLIT